MDFDNIQNTPYPAQIVMLQRGFYIKEKEKMSKAQKTKEKKT